MEDTAKFKIFSSSSLGYDETTLTLVFEKAIKWLEEQKNLEILNIADGFDAEYAYAWITIYYKERK